MISIFRKLRHRTSWSIAVYLQDRLEIPPATRPVVLLTSVRLIRGPRHTHTRADPFLFSRGERLYVFYETQCLDDPGKIEATELTAAGPVHLGVILAEDGHLSYPHVFEIDGHIYMIPESQALGELRLYRFTDFPRGLVLERVLAEGAYADPSPIKRDGQWYIFATGPRGLELFVTDDLAAGELSLHPASPITADPRYSRCGGVPFDLDGKLVRPAQNCAVTYGGNLNLMAIEQLSPTDYREGLLQADVFNNDQNWNRQGAHHISVAPMGNRYAIAVDGQANDYLIYKFITRAWMMLTGYRRQAS